MHGPESGDNYRHCLALRQHVFPVLSRDEEEGEEPKLEGEGEGTYKAVHKPINVSKMPRSEYNCQEACPDNANGYHYNTLRRDF